MVNAAASYGVMMQLKISISAGKASRAGKHGIISFMKSWKGSGAGRC